MNNKGFSVEGKVALVSGANRGIGKAITIELLQKGAKKVYAGVRDKASLNDLVEKYGKKLFPIMLDVTDQDSIEQCISKIDDIDILVNNAGTLTPGGFKDQNAVDTLQKNLDVNVFGVLKMTQAIFPKIQEKSFGAIVNIVSMGGLANMPVIGTYCISKAAVHSATQLLRAELKGSHVLVSGVYPGPIQTDLIDGFGIENADSPENVAKHIVQGIEEGKEYIFPDVMSHQMGAKYLSSPQEIEQTFSHF